MGKFTCLSSSLIRFLDYLLYKHTLNVSLCILIFIQNHKMSLIKLGCLCFTLLFSYEVFNWIVYGESVRVYAFSSFSRNLKTVIVNISCFQIWNFFLLFTSLAHVLLYSLYFIDPVKTVKHWSYPSSYSSSLLHPHTCYSSFPTISPLSRFVSWMQINKLFSLLSEHWCRSWLLQRWETTSKFRAIIFMQALTRIVSR